MFYILLEPLEIALKSQEIDQMEPAILVLGAISDMDGALNMISYHLPNLVPFLMEVLKNNSELIRATTIWTLSKFTDWISRDATLLDEYLKVLC